MSVGERPRARRARRTRGKDAEEAPKTFVSRVTEHSAPVFARRRGTGLQGGGGAGTQESRLGARNCCCGKPGGQGWSCGQAEARAKGGWRGRGAERTKGLSVAPAAGRLLLGGRPRICPRIPAPSPPPAPRQVFPFQLFLRCNLPPLTSGNQRGLYGVSGISQTLAPAWRTQSGSGWETKGGLRRLGRGESPPPHVRPRAARPGGRTTLL